VSSKVKSAAHALCTLNASHWCVSCTVPMRGWDWARTGTIFETLSFCFLFPFFYLINTQRLSFNPKHFAADTSPPCPKPVMVLVDVTLEFGFLIKRMTPSTYVFKYEEETRNFGIYYMQFIMGTRCCP